MHAGTAVQLAKININDDDTIDEVDEYISMRSLTAAEALWRIFGFDTNWKHPSVECLDLHLPQQDTLTFTDDDAQDAILSGQSKLLRYLSRPRAEPWRSQKYLEYYRLNSFKKVEGGPPVRAKLYDIDYDDEAESRGIVRHYVYPRCGGPTHALPNAHMHACRQDPGGHISRMPLIFPSKGEVFYLRALLAELAPLSWEELLIDQHDSTMSHPTYQAAARALGLFDDVTELESTFKLATQLCISAKQLRSLFICTLLEGGNGPALMQHCQEQDPNPMGDDYPQASRQNELLKDLRNRLDMHNKTLSDYGLPEPQDDTTLEGRYWINQERNPQDTNELPDPSEEEQQDALQMIDNAVADYLRCKQTSLSQAWPSHFVCIDGRSGSGKTTIAKITESKYIKEGLVVVCVAPTGLASLNFEVNGDTGHHMFDLPVDDDAHGKPCPINSRCEMHSLRADFLRRVDIITWDELANQNRYCVEATHDLLCDLMAVPADRRLSMPFAGKVVIGLMDFRQIAPVVPNGSREEVYKATICCSWLWRAKAELKCLQQSQRDKQDPLYARFVLDIGNDHHQKYKLRCSAWSDIGGGPTLCTSTYSDMIRIPTKVDLKNPERAQLQLKHSNKVTECLQFAFGAELQEDFVGKPAAERLAIATRLAKSAVLATLNRVVDEVNHAALSMLPGASNVMRSATSLADTKMSAEKLLYTQEYLNGLRPKNIPPHELELKIGALVMFTRNLSREEKQMNGSKGIVIGVPNPFLLHMLMLPSGELTTIRRISFYFMDGNIKIKRSQFPIRVAFATSSNKSQGQTLLKVVYDIRNGAFTHGQCFVSNGRVCNKGSIMYLTDDQCLGAEDNVYMRNIVWPELLQHCSIPPAPSTSNQIRVEGKPPAATAQATSDSSTHSNNTLATSAAPSRQAAAAPCKVASTSSAHMHTKPFTCDHTWGDGHCFYYATAQDLQLLSEHHRAILEQMVSCRFSNCACCCAIAKEAKSKAASEQDYVPNGVLDSCGCEQCGAILAHRQIASMLREVTANSMAHLESYFEVLENPNVDQSLNDRDNFQAQIRQRAQATSPCVVATQSNEGWAGDPQLRAMAVHLNRDIIALHPANAARLYTATTPTNDQARASINSVGLLAAMQGQGSLGWYFRSITWQEAQLLKAAKQQTIVMYYNGINHFESVKMS